MIDAPWDKLLTLLGTLLSVGMALYIARMGTAQAKAREDDNHVREDDKRRRDAQPDLEAELTRRFQLLLNERDSRINALEAEIATGRAQLRTVQLEMQNADEECRRTLLGLARVMEEAGLTPPPLERRRRLP